MEEMKWSRWEMSFHHATQCADACSSNAVRSDFMNERKHFGNRRWMNTLAGIFSVGVLIFRTIRLERTRHIECHTQAKEWNLIVKTFHVITMKDPSQHISHRHLSTFSRHFRIKLRVFKFFTFSLSTSTHRQRRLNTILVFIFKLS